MHITLPASFEMRSLTIDMRHGHTQIVGAISVNGGKSFERHFHVREVLRPEHAERLESLMKEISLVACEDAKTQICNKGLDGLGGAY